MPFKDHTCKDWTKISVLVIVWFEIQVWKSMFFLVKNHLKATQFMSFWKAYCKIQGVICVFLLNVIATKWQHHHYATNPKPKVTNLFYLINYCSPSPLPRKWDFAIMHNYISGWQCNEGWDSLVTTKILIVLGS